jgi:fucose permease
MTEITVLVTANFGFQLLTDLVAPRYVDRIGYRASLIIAHVLCSLGLIGLVALPELMGGFFGLLLSTVIYAVGGGLLEVLVSPVLESIPMDNKSGAMSLLHSFYCWGSVATVLLSTLFFSLFGIENWKILSLLFAAFPLINAFFFTKVPLMSPPPVKKGSAKLYKELLTNKTFLLFLVMMICSGAAEMAVQQWSSVFAETALKVDKASGDLFGMCGFSVTMALSRVIYGKFTEKLPLKTSLFVSSLLCAVCYLMISLSINPIVGFVGCILCGFAVGIFWPGSFSLASSGMPTQSTLMFALLSLAGDVGCTVGPTIAGFVSNFSGGDLQVGILSCIVFPLLLPVCLILICVTDKRTNNRKM